MAPALITLEEHYVSDSIRSHLSESGDGDHYKDFPAPIIAKLKDLDNGRLADMDAGGVSLQIISHGPLDAPLPACRKANDELAAACKKNPKRLAGFAMLPMMQPDEAAQELERCVKDLGFPGALINNHLNGQFYDDEKFWPVFAKAQELDVAVYIHPTFASDEMAEHYKGNFSDQAARMMSIAGWGWHTETGLHVLRLWTSGLFDRYPKLKIIIGHMGEMLPYQLDRIIPMAAIWGKDRKRDLRTIWNENFWITTSGMFSLAPLTCLLKMCSIDHILYSVDYPFSSNDKGLKFVEVVEKSGLLSKEDLEKVCSGNAKKLLRIKV